MPYSKVQDHDECDGGQWAVVKDEDGEVMGCHATEGDADDQISALEAEEAEAGANIRKPTLGDGSGGPQSVSLAAEDVKFPDIAEFVASHLDGADPQDVAALTDQFEYVGAIDARELATLVGQVVDMSTGDVLDRFEEMQGEEMSVDVRRPMLLQASGGDGESEVPEEIVQLRSKESQRLTFRSGRTATAEPTPQDMEKINEIATRDLSADEVVIFEDLAASNEAMPRRPMRLTESALLRLRDRYKQGRQLRAMHDANERVGSTFDASVGEEVVDGRSALWLRVRSYAVLNEDTTDDRRQLIQDMQTGVLNHTSIHAEGGEWETVELGEDAERPFRIDIKDNPDAGSDRLEARELSRVDLPAVESAQAVQ